MIAEADSVCILWAMGVTQHSQGSDTSTAISNLLLVTGNYMRPGTGAYPLRGHNNVQGASDHGSMPNFLPGLPARERPGNSRAIRRRWNVKLPTTKGLDNHEMVDAIHAGKLKSMYLFGEEMSLVDSNANYVAEAFSKLEFFVVQDIFFSHDLPLSRDVVLPACPSLEKEGTFTSTERRIQRLYQVFDPLGRQPPRLENHSGHCQPPGRQLELRASLRNHGRNRVADAAVCGRQLRAARRIQDPAMARGGRRHRPAASTTPKEFAFPDGKARLFPLSWTEPRRRARRANSICT